MNSDFYRNYIQIVELGTLSAAANHLHIAQSALSSQIRQFEELYGAEMFVRNARHMKLTDAGRILYEKAKSIVSIEDAARAEIADCVGGVKGTVRIGMTIAYPDANIINMLMEFQRNNPEVCYEFYEETSNEIMEMVRTNAVEIGIIRISGQLPPYLEEQMKFKQELCVYCCYNNAWISPFDKEVKISSLHEVPLLIPRGEEKCLRDIFQRENVQPHIKNISTSRVNPIIWADAGMGVAIIYNGSTETVNDAKSFYRPLCSDNNEILEKLKSFRAFVTAKKHALSPVSRKLIEFSKTYFSE